MSAAVEQAQVFRTGFDDTHGNRPQITLRAADRRSRMIHQGRVAISQPVGRRSAALRPPDVASSLDPALLLARGAAVQERWPSRPIPFIVPFAVGATTDLLARALAPRMAEQLRQPVVVDNIPGAGGTVGTSRLAKLPADGYSIGIGQTADLITGPLLRKDVDYDPVRELTPVARLLDLSQLLVVRADSPYRLLDDLLAAARAKPGSIIFSTSGIGGTPHLIGEVLQQHAKVKLLHAGTTSNW